MRLISFCFGCLFLASVSTAEFKPAEKEEIQKLVQAALETSLALDNVAASFQQAGTDSNRKAHADALLGLVMANHHLSEGFRKLFHAPRGSDPFPAFRGAEVFEAFNSFSAAQQRLNSAQKGIEAMPSNSQRQTAANRVSKAQAFMQSFDRGLAYADWRSASFPTVVGPHGDFLMGQHDLARVAQYFTHTVFDAVRLLDPAVTPVFPAPAKGDFYQVMRNASGAFQPLFRAWAMESGVVLDDDDAKIRADERAGSGLRPASFFRLLLEVEYILNDTDQTPSVNFGGRRLERGMTSFLFPMTKFFGSLAERLMFANGSTWFMNQWRRCSIQIGDMVNCGRIREFYTDLPDFWPNMDGVSHSWMGFFHDIPAPPR
jgi:hypothetical protein